MKGVDECFQMPTVLWYCFNLKYQKKSFQFPESFVFKTKKGAINLDDHFCLCSSDFITNVHIGKAYYNSYKTANMEQDLCTAGISPNSLYSETSWWLNRSI